MAWTRLADSPGWPEGISIILNAPMVITAPKAPAATKDKNCFIIRVSFQSEWTKFKRASETPVSNGFWFNVSLTLGVEEWRSEGIKECFARHSFSEGGEDLSS